ncbi:MAG: helicase HerA domain-containing protein, partial [Anaerovoracaceae bacterium]
MTSFEKLGQFYLGKTVDPEDGKKTQGYFMYEAKDLTTHALCVGMTGSGKTGLCIDLLEEAAIDGIPAIVVDPKGDLGNLLLRFPDFEPASFLPYISEEEAAQKGVSKEALAAETAQSWKEGVAAWDQGRDRYDLLSKGADFALYTPGSQGGRPLSILEVFDAPPTEILEDPDLLSDYVAGSAGILLNLLGIETDPINSKDHILISNILMDSWRQGKNLSVAELILAIQSPPFTQVGVLALDDFYPPKDRNSLAMSLNNLLASPRFASWTAGEPLRIQDLLYTKEGKAKVSILTLSHLSDEERMFFVSLLLNQLLAWCRGQSGTQSLRALFYMDEIYGYFPPVANPPSKGPLLTLLKQARAYGLGLVLSTQNPVDLDYKGLSNIGTWFIGRLQTDRDKQRLIDGLESASAQAGEGFQREAMDKMLSAMGKRVFLMKNIHEESLQLFESRFCLSYLAGPLSREQIKRLSEKGNANTPVTATADQMEGSAPPATGGPQEAEPLPPSQASAPAPTAEGPSASLPQDPPAGIGTFFCHKGPGVYHPALAASVTVNFVEKKSGIDETRELFYYVPITDGLISVDWSANAKDDLKVEDLVSQAPQGASFSPLPQAALQKTAYTKWQQELVAYVVDKAKLPLFENKRLKAISKPGESQQDFQARLSLLQREERDGAMEALRSKYQTKMATLQERIRKAEQAVDREKKQAAEAKLQTGLSLGGAIVGALLGRKAVSVTSVGKLTTAGKAATRAGRQA